MKRFILVAAARPNFMKVAPLVRHRKAEPFSRNKEGKGEIRVGPHRPNYDFNMSDSFFKDLKLPNPHITWESVQEVMPSRPERS